MALYFEKGHAPEVQAAVLEAFVRALADVPAWAMHQGFDAWIRTGKRRPSPAEIRDLALDSMWPIRDELETRRKRETAQDSAQDRQPISPQRAAEIMEIAGFTPKKIEEIRSAPMARSMEEAGGTTTVRQPHWTETADPNGPEMRALHAARAANRLAIRPDAESQP